MNRSAKKEVIRELYNQLVVRIRELENESEKNRDHLSTVNVFRCMFKQYVLFSDEKRIPIMSLIVLKELITHIHMYEIVPIDQFKAWSALFLDLGVHHICFSHTFNHLMKNRTNILNNTL